VTADVDGRVSALADTLAASGDLTDDRWRAALRAVPRHLFVPDVAWAAPAGASGYRIDRNADPDGWMDAAYADQPIIIQLNDGATDVGAGTGAFTSSLSEPGVVVDFLERLNVHDGDRVLEIGTGSGWTAALLSHRLGSGNVTTVEIDPGVSMRAAARLKETDYSPRLVVGDGANGWPHGAPYDRMHITCGVTIVPYAWVAQTRPGGVIVLPWMPEYAGGHKLKLTVLPDGTAVGRFHGSCGYMMMRSQRSTRTDLDGEYRQTVPAVDPRRIVWASWGADVAIAGMLPDVSATQEKDHGEFRMRLWTADSEALVTWAPDLGTSAVRQRGPRDLWEELEAAFFAWVNLGEPGRDRFGMTVTPTGQQVWLESPDQVLSPPT
jgi:protein-L-isoaspartate O-methyltransferase